MRVPVEWRSSSKENYRDFCKNNPNVKISFEKWKDIIYSFNESVRDEILETGEKFKLPGGFGEISIKKKKRKRIKTDPKTGREFINLPVDWKRTKEKGKIIYNFNFHTEGYFFGWQWFKSTARFKHSDLWYFKPSRVSSRMLSSYINKDVKYQHIYKEYQE